MSVSRRVVTQGKSRVNTGITEKCYVLSELLGRISRFHIFMDHMLRVPHEGWLDGLTIVIHGHFLSPHHEAGAPLDESEQQVVSYCLTLLARQPERVVVIFGAKEYERWLVTRDSNLGRLLELSYVVYLWQDAWLFSFGTVRKLWLKDLVHPERPTLENVNLAWRTQVVPETSKLRSSSVWYHKESPLYNTVATLAPSAWYEEDVSFLRLSLAPEGMGHLRHVMSITPTQTVVRRSFGQWLPLRRAGHRASYGFLQWFSAELMTASRERFETPELLLSYRAPHEALEMTHTRTKPALFASYEMLVFTVRLDERTGVRLHVEPAVAVWKKAP